jgi:methylated-DNA-[protein]-cysteine S-methyltransferase
MGDVAGIFARESGVLNRYVQVGIAQGRVISVDFPERPQAEAKAGHRLLERIEAYLEGTGEDLADVAVALTLQTDRRRVLEAVREVPYGESTTAEGVARMTPGLDDGSEEDLGTVREALLSNPAPILVPDHRVRDAAGAAPDDVAAVCRQVEGLQ